MKIVVTGGAGFIGSNLTEKLVQLKHNVVVVDNLSTGNLDNLKNIKDKISFVNIDISKEKEKLKEAFNKAECVYHLAGLADIVPSIKNPEKYFESNVIGTLNVLEASKKNKIKRFIYAASASCYGIPKKFPTDENSEIDTQYPYALTKYLGEKIVLHWSNIYKIPSVSLRFFNVYGPRSRTTGAYGAVFGVFLAQKLSKKPLTIVGDGNQTRDFIHVYDLVSALVISLEKGKNSEIYNVAGGKEISVNQIANIIGGEKVFIPKRPGEPDRSLADITKIKSEFNWEPKIDIEEGVKKLLSEIDSWKDAPVWTPESIKEATKEWFEYLKK